jgi:hypothetical protein
VSEEVRSFGNSALDYCAAEVYVERWPGTGPASVAAVCWKPSLADLSLESAMVSSGRQDEQFEQASTVSWVEPKRSHW